MGAFTDGNIYVPDIGETGWGTDVSNNLRRLSDLAVNPKAFGAVGDGIANDTTAVQNALTAAAGGTCFLPKGTFLTGKLSIPSGTRVVGAGRSTTLKLANSSNSPLLENADTANGNSDIHISDLTLDCNGANQASGIRFGAHLRRVSRVAMDRLRVLNPGQDGIYVGANLASSAGTESADVTVRDCIIEAPGRNGVSITGGRRVWVHSTHVYQPALMGIDFEANTGLIVDEGGCVGCIVIGPASQTGAGGFVASDAAGGARHIRFIGCKAKNFTGQLDGAGIRLRGISVSAVDCTVENILGTGTTGGFVIDAFSGSKRITGGNAVDCERGIHITANSTGQVIISGVEVHGSKSPGIQVESQSVGGVITGCRITNSGQTGDQPAIRLNNSSRYTITGNFATDTQGSKTQTWGVQMVNAGSGHVVLGNDFAGNKTGGVSVGGHTGVINDHNQS